jgi:cation diffusion facilitator family transporter
MTVTEAHARWSSTHDHAFGENQSRAQERRTLIVVAITAATMVAEIAAGVIYGSMALLADGLHMASHAVALGIAAFAYRYARQHASDPRFSFGTGKVNALAGYSGAVLLGVFALGMAGESFERFLSPVEIAVDQALAVAVLGLVVNGVSVAILGAEAGHGQSHGHGDAHHDHQHHDHNYRSAYLHVLADALTSVLAILALLAAKYWGASWLDPLMGVVGSALVARWSWGLLRESGRVLLDRQVDDAELERIRASVEHAGQHRIADLHVWSIGAGRKAAILAIESPSPCSLEEYRSLLPKNLGLEHVTIEIAPSARCGSPHQS